MRVIVFLVAALLSSAAFAVPDCSNYSGTSLAGCGTADFSAALGPQDESVDERNSIHNRPDDFDPTPDEPGEPTT